MDKQKQEIIDKFINDNRGKNLGQIESINDVDVSGGYLVRRASELGWISGFQWGVEYPTNGKKPDLPDDVYVDVKCHSTKTDWKGYTDLKVSGVCWGNPNGYEVPAVSFRIIDSRYKPKQPKEQSKPSNGFAESATAIKKPGDALRPDNSWHEKSELPPAGTECEYTIGERPKKTCTFVGLNSRAA